MGCCSSTANSPSSPLPVAAESASVPVEPVRVLTETPPVSEPSSANLSRTRSRTQSLHQATRHSRERSGSTHRTRTQSTPQNAQPMRSVSSQDRRIRAQTLVTPGMGSHSIPGPSNPAHPTRKAGTRSLTSTMRQVLSNHTKFRILVVGKRGSGKTSLINAVFKVNIPATPGKPDISHEIHPDDNRYLVVHESPGFGPGDGQNLQAIRDFISNRTDPSCSNAERLHAMWICVPISDAITGTVGGVEEILKMRQVPVVVAFTKFDQIVEIEGGISARNRARTQFEQSCRSLFRKEP